MPVIPPFLGRLRRGEDFIGSGFLVGDGTLVVTCAHVVGDPGTGAVNAGRELMFEPLASLQQASERASSSPLGWSIQTTELFDFRSDIAILERKKDGSSRELASEAALVAPSRGLDFGELRGYGWRTAGYSLLPDNEATYDFTSTAGLVIGPAIREGVEVLQLRGNEVQRGMSGAPVILDNYGVVIGVISQRFHSPDNYSSNTVWAVRSENVLRVARGLVAAVPIAKELSETLTAFDKLQRIAPRMSSEARISVEVEIARGYVFGDSIGGGDQ